MKKPLSGCAEIWNRLVIVKADDEEVARLGRLFNILMVISLGIVVTLSLVFLSMPSLGLLSTRVSWIAAAFPLAFIPLSLLSLAQSRRGHVRSMVRLYSWVNLTAIGLAAWLFDGIYSPAWPLFIWTITVAGTLLAPAYSLWMTGGVVAYFLLLLQLTRAGVYTPLLSFGDAGREFVHLSFLLIMLISSVGLLTYLNMRSLREVLGRLRNEVAVRKRTEEHLRQSEERFRNVFDNAGDIIFTISREGRYLSLNPAFEKISGWPVQEWMGRSFTPLIAPDDLPRALEVLQKTLSGKTVELFELTVRKKNGECFIGEFIVAPLKQGDDVILLGICRDITERKGMEAQIRQLNEVLEAKVQQRTQQLLETQEALLRKEKLAVLGQVAGSVGHELRNPLGVMSNAVYYLQTVLTGADGSVKEYLTILKNEIANSERIVSDLLDSVRIKPPQPEAVAIAELLAQTLQKCSVLDTVTVQMDFPAALPRLWVDPRQIDQVFRNLIDNALEAMPGGGKLTIQAVENQPEGTVAITVRDDGLGMSAEQLHKLFQPLFTTKARGIGLGLVVVKNLTEANGGSVAVQSEPGQGSTFSITFPCERAAMATA